MGGRPMAGHAALDRSIGVRIPVSQRFFKMEHSSSGLGHRPLTPAAGVRLPYALLP